MTLRNAVLVIALAALVAGFVLFAAGAAEGVKVAIAGGVLTLLVVGERWRYVRRRRGTEADSHFEKTDERYHDPETGELIEVEFDSKTGARRYVPVRSGGPRPAP